MNQCLFSAASDSLVRFSTERVSILFKKLDANELRNLCHVTAVFCCSKRETESPHNSSCF